MLESLENRRFVSVTLCDTGALRVLGGNGPDDVGMWQPTKETLNVDLNGAVTAFDVDDVKSIFVDVGAGNERVIVGKRDVPATLLGQAGDDLLSSGNGDDFLHGGSGDDYLFGRDGDDRIDGGGGGDLILGGKDADTVDYSARWKRVYVSVGNASLDGEKWEGDVVCGDIERVLGGHGSDHLRNSGAQPVVLIGNKGHDKLEARFAEDALYGGPGHDTFRGVGGLKYVNSLDAADGSRDEIFIGGTTIDAVKADGIDIVHVI